MKKVTLLCIEAEILGKQYKFYSNKLPSEYFEQQVKKISTTAYIKEVYKTRVSVEEAEKFDFDKNINK